MGRLTYSASGAVASFKAAGHAPVRHAKFNFTPTQDLHGQSAPYPAGGGVNVLRTFETAPTISGLTINVGEDGKITISGTVSETTVIDAPVTSWQWDGTSDYWLSGCPAGGNSTNSYSLRVDGDNDWSKYDIGSGVQLASFYNKDISFKNLKFMIVLRAGTYSNLTFAPMLNAGLSAQPYQPYSNVCPIIGWTGLTGYKDSKHGGLIQWNQLVQNGNFADGYTPWVIAANWKTKEVSNGVLHLVSTANQPSYANLLQECGNTIGHVYLCSIWVKSSKATRLEAAVGTTNGGGVFSWQNSPYTADTWTLFSGVSKPTSASNANFYIRPKNTDNEEEVDVYLKNVCLFDLTQMFGSTIADYIYSLETSTAGAGVAWFRAMFPLDYYAYNAGTQTTVDAVNGKTDTMYPIDWTDEAGTVYGGYVDLVTGEVWKTWEMVDSGTLYWSKDSVSGRFYTGSLTPYISSKPLCVMCEKYVTNIWPTNDYINTAHDNAICTASTKYIYVIDRTSYANMDGAAYKTSMSGVMLAYELATPTLVTTLSPTELQTFIGENHIWSDANGNTVVEYDAHEATEVFLARKRLIEENSPVERTVTGTAASFTTRSVLPLKECKCEFSPVQDLHGETAPYPAGGGINIWDEEAVGGYYNASGELVSSTTLVCTKNKVAVLPNTEYTIVIPLAGGSSISLCEYTSEETFIKREALGISGSGGYRKYTTSATCGFITVNFSSAYGSTYNHDISINYPSTDTSYHPYANICPITGWTGATVYDDTKYGGMIQWNQLVQNGNFANSNNWISYDATKTSLSIANGIATITCLESGNDYHLGLQQVLAQFAVVGNVVLVGGEIKVPKIGSYGFDIGGTSSGSNRYVQTTDWTNITFIKKISRARNALIAMPDGITLEVGDVIQFKNIVIHDLTQMFDSTIADYLYTLEQSTPGAGVVYFRSLFPASYYPYNAGTLTTVNAVNGDTVNSYPVSFGGLSKNLLNQSDFVATSQTVGNYNTYQAGTYTVSFNVVNSTAIAGNFSLRDSNNTNAVNIPIPQNANTRLSGTFTLEEEKELRIVVSATNSGYNFAISNIQVEAGNKATDYEPYGTIYGGYVDPVKGVAVATYGSVDLGTLTWEEVKDGVYKSAGLVGIVKEPIGSNGVANIVCEKYMKASYATLYADSVDNTIAVIWSASNVHGQVWVRDSAYTDAATFKTAMNGVYLVYELATPITYQLTPQQIRSLIGQNNVFSDVNGNTTVKYWKL